MDTGKSNFQDGLETMQEKEPSPSHTPAPMSLDEDDDDPQKTIPLTRYNTMLAILKNTLYL